MQLTARYALEPDDDGWWSQPSAEPTPPSLSVLEADARRCAVCNARWPTFGFGPPFIRRGDFVWSCGPHRDVMERRLTAGARTPAEPQPSLI